MVIDLREALSAPSVEDAPVPAGMLLAQANPFSPEDDAAFTRIPVGQPYLLTPAGEWRQFDLERYGFDDEPYGELAMAISADGRQVAFAEPSGLVVVNLRSGNFERYEVPVTEAASLQWAPDGSALLFKDRDAARQPCGSKGCVLETSTGRLTPVEFEAFQSTYANRGVVFEVKPGQNQQTGQVVTYRGDALAKKTSLEYSISGLAGRPAGARDVAFVQCNRARPNGGDGVSVVDATSGRLIAVLRSARTSACQLSGGLTWASDDHLIVTSWKSGAVWLWSVPQRRVRQIAVSQFSGVNLSFAGEVVEERFDE